ncbi:MAG TPA: hypothetical protein DDY53_02305 [Clostridiales bacterium]|jgi:ribosome biogenesis protein Nip4|nr:hypothetical protein [Clostridiales bacterium]
MLKMKKSNIIVLSFIVLILFIILVLSFIILNNNKTKVYAISGESKNFYYSNALFISSNNKNIYVYGDLTSKDKNIKITSVALMSENRLIVKSDSLPQGISIENVGYDELFPKKVVNNLDNWYLEIIFNNDEGENTEKLNLINNLLIN